MTIRDFQVSPCLARGDLAICVEIGPRSGPRSPRTPRGFILIARGWTANAGLPRVLREKFHQPQRGCIIQPVNHLKMTQPRWGWLRGGANPG